ncbi:MAG: recombinase [Mesorhizobium sp.]|nr:MAG: recombinase [Mesorhizobium sp.]
MSTRYGMEPAAFEATVRATCMPPDKNGRVPTREEFAAFLLVAREYSLNPITKEIYAFSGKGGGIVPIVSIDGWANLINSHGQLDGITFDMQHNDAGELVSCTCTIYRKDRTHPIQVTEYLSECIRATDPWKMKHRMLRHKSLIQCARYAFGFAGIYDEDEGERIVEASATHSEPPRPPRPTSAPPKPNGSAQPAGEPAKQQPPKPVADQQQSELAGKDVEEAVIEDEIPNFDRDTGEILDDGADGEGNVDESEEQQLTPTDMLTLLDDAMATKSTEADVLELWNEHDLPARLTHVEKGEEFVAISKAIRDKHLKRVRKS